MFDYATEPGAGWVRFFGVAVRWKDTRRHALLFSERYGHRRYWMVGPWCISLLRIKGL